MLTETLRRAAAREGIELPPGSETALVDHWHELPIFDDVGPALSALRERGWSLAILSNCDDDLLATTLERMPVPFDLTVTAEQVCSYKPDPGHWRAFAERTEGDRGRWVHAAQSWFHDIVTAAELGLPRVWVDRLDSGEDAARATVRIRELSGLPDAVERAGWRRAASSRCSSQAPAPRVGRPRLRRAPRARRRSAASPRRTTCRRRAA